jgi:hypothetical protein
VITWKLERDKLKVGQEVEVVGYNKTAMPSSCWRWFGRGGQNHIVGRRGAATLSK